MKHQRGLTMIELLVGLAIGSLIVMGAVFVYSQSRTTYTTNETAARLQENARYALAILEPDIQLAGYYGFSNNALDFRYYASASAQTPVTDLEQADAAMSSPPGGVTTCGNNFAVDLLATVQGSNDAAGPITTCAPPSSSPNAGAYVTNTDTLTIRRASTVSATATAARVQLYVNALKRANQFVFNNASAPSTVDTNRQVRNLIVRTYYVAANSQARTGFPTLWRKSLDSNGTAPLVIDEEILPGVEDFQVQFGIDTGDHDGVSGIDIDADGNGVPDMVNGVISRWVNPDSALLNSPDATTPGINAQVVAVRVWLRLRAEDRETGFTDNRTYTYANRPAFTPTGADANVRRLLVSRTYFLRNSRTF
jgi:type IV pilus assembly protein PilW